MVHPIGTSGQKRTMERRLAAILAADVAGYSRLMGANEAGTLADLNAHRRELVDGKIAEHRGRIVKLTGDGMLAEFASVVDAVACAADIQRRMAERNLEVPEDRRIQFRIGINLGDVIHQDGDIYGDGVNVAARIEAFARPGGVAVSALVRDSVGNRLDLGFDDAGEQRLKNIDRPVRVFNVVAPGRDSTAPSARVLAPAHRDRPSIAVLPFSNMSGDAEQEYFADGIAEDIITDLSKISGLFVIGRNTSFTYKGRAVKLQEVAGELGVGFLLEGSVRKAGARVRVTAQLIDGASGGHVWAERFDREMTDIFAIQDDITRTIVEQLQVRLLPDERKVIGQPPTQSVEAYTCYLRGRQFLHMKTRSFLQQARSMFAKAVELDPLYARAYAGMADCETFLSNWHSVTIPVDDILATADKALAIDANLTEAHAARGAALTIGGRYDEAATAFERALALDPLSYEAHFSYGLLCMIRCDFERSAQHYLRALEIQPGDYRSPIHRKKALNALGRRDEAQAYARLGLKRAEEAMRLHPDSADPVQQAAVALAALGERDRAREYRARALAIDPDDISGRFNWICLYALLGEIEIAIETLAAWLPLVGAVEWAWIRSDSDLESLRSQPRYLALMHVPSLAAGPSPRR
jgi:adenylate cyclase